MHDNKNMETEIIENADGSADITVYCTKEDYDLIENAAKLAGKSIDNYASECLKKYIRECEIKRGIDTSNKED